MDYLWPTAVDTGFDAYSEVMPGHDPIGAKGIGECAAGGGRRVRGTVMDALGETGVRNIDMPLLLIDVLEALTMQEEVDFAGVDSAG